MYIVQQGIGEALYWLSNDPLGTISVNPEDWKTYVRKTHDGWPRKEDVEMYTHGGATTRKFSVRLASLAAELKYEGYSLFAIQFGHYSEGDYSWSGVTGLHSAFTIHGMEDYGYAQKFYLANDGHYAAGEMNYSIIVVAAPTSIIE